MKELYLRATQDIGVRERPGRNDNSPEILDYFAAAGHRWAKRDETPWCSAAVCRWCHDLDIPQTNSLRARSWLEVRGNYRYAVAGVPDPSLLQIGDIVVLWRTSPDSANGHVGLFAAHRRDRIWLLGGNQDDRVKIKSYPVSRFLSARRFVPKSE